jgi:hypothetical protein
LLLVAIGCPQQKAAAPVARPPVNITLAFRDASKNGDPALLQYAVTGPAGEQALKMTSVKEQPEAKVDSEYAIVRVKPYALAPRITNEMLQECIARGAWSLCVREPGGAHVGDFEINDWGALILKNGTTDDGLEIERVTADKRSLFFVYRKQSGGVRGDALLVLEYVRNEFYTRHETVGSDGWNYTFENPAGTVALHDPASLTTRREMMLAMAGGEKEQREKELSDWASRPKPCTGGG